LLARPLAQCVSWSRIARRLVIVPISVEFTAAFSSAPGLENTRVSYSPTHIATVVEGTTSHAFNTFIVTIAREGTSRRLQFDGTNYPPADPENTFSVFIRQAADMSFQSVPVWIHGDTASLGVGRSPVEFDGPRARQTRLGLLRRAMRGSPIERCDEGTGPIAPLP
jgi:hypothetical protein